MDALAPPFEFHRLLNYLRVGKSLRPGKKSMSSSRNSSSRRWNIGRRTGIQTRKASPAVSAMSSLTNSQNTQPTPRPSGTSFYPPCLAGETRPRAYSATYSSAFFLWTLINRSWWAWIMPACVSKSEDGARVVESVSPLLKMCAGQKKPAA